MTAYEAFLRSLEAGDSDSAKAFLRSKHWPAEDRARAERLLRSARDVAWEVLPS